MHGYDNMIHDIQEIQQNPWLAGDGTTAVFCGPGDALEEGQYYIAKVRHMKPNTKRWRDIKAERYLYNPDEHETEPAPVFEPGTTTVIEIMYWLNMKDESGISPADRYEIKTTSDISDIVSKLPGKVIVIPQ
jgi:hypothetical protein